MTTARTIRKCSRLKTLAAALILQTAAGAAAAAPVTYRFSTGASPFGAPALTALFGAGTFVSGTFEYDALSLATSTTSSGMTLYGIQNVPGFPASFLNLSGTVGGFSFADARGTTLVGNDNFVLNDFSTTPPTSQLVDFVQLNTQSQTPMTGFSVGGYTLQNVRMFWIEGQQTPGTIPDFLSSQSLPSVLPGFQGRLALDFVPTGGGAQSFVFYDGLTVTPVPEPETYAMLLAGLGLLTLTARRRTRAA